ncbi:B3 domain-containing protein REM16 [Sesamum alatum]|uniref:B3 domain-containing protein REM16 n=1 Tax=Sesamum alatum TaxID=300844 RepID=A0AAE2CB74_9LAMI|nr:B3 domain-containing protein REM16 [Sesamum alatum]
MGRKSKSRPSFFKIMIKDVFTRHLRLPPYFVQKYGEVLPENVRLRSSSGETWNVEIEQMNEDEHFFTRGWSKFAQDVGLKMGEFMVFWFNTGDSTFDVSVYGISGCERRISACNSPVDRSDPDEEMKEDACDVNIDKSRAYVVANEVGTAAEQKHDHYTVEEANPVFKLLLKKHHRSRVFVRKSFAIAAGLMDARVAVLQYPPNERCWPVLLERYSKLSQFRIDIGIGWADFRRKNCLVYGKNYSFEYVRDKNVIEVKLIDG